MIGHVGVSDSALERFCSGNASRRETRRIVRHLAAGCRQCLDRTRRLWPGRQVSDGSEEPPGLQYDYSAAFTRVQEVVQDHEVFLAEDMATVPARMAELERHPPDRQWILIQNSTQFRSWGLAQALLEDCEPALRQDTVRGSRLAQLAIWVTDSLDPRLYGRRRVNDLRARARAEFGAALRCSNQLRRAAITFREAREVLELGTGEPVEKANVLFLEAGLWIDCHKFEEASRLLDRVIALARRIGEKQLLCRALLSQIRCQAEQGQSDQLLPLSLEAQRLLDASSDPRLALVLQHNVLYALVRAERFEEAAAGLDDTRILHDELNFPIDRLRFDWLEAEVLFGLGKDGEAEGIYRSILDSFLGRKMYYDAALVALELALVFERQHRLDELRSLCSALVPLFQSERVGREVIAALLIFREAVELERLSRELIQELRNSIRQGGRGAASAPERSSAAATAS